MIEFIMTGASLVVGVAFCCLLVLIVMDFFGIANTKIDPAYRSKSGGGSSDSGTGSYSGFYGGGDSSCGGDGGGCGGGD
jgi:hypothetical protein